MMVQEEAELAKALEEKISSSPWAALLFTGTMPEEPWVPLESGIFDAPVPDEDPARIRAA
jgi:hypothetical protein